MISKDTVLYGHFAMDPTSAGTRFFNRAFRFCGIDAIYKPFKVSPIGAAFDAARTLHMGGFSVSSEWTESALGYANEYSPDVNALMAADTFINIKGRFKAYNSMVHAVQVLMLDHEGPIAILGADLYTPAIERAAENLGQEAQRLSDLDSVSKNTMVFNCTPKAVSSDSLVIIKPDSDTYWGAEVAERRAEYQFELYTGRRLGRAQY